MTSRILIHEPSHDIQSLYRAILHPLQARSLFVQNPEDVPPLLAHGGFSLLIVDHIGPREPGLGLVEWANRMHPELPVLLASTVELSVRELYSLSRSSLNDFVRKPFDIDRLRKIVDRAVNRTAGRHHPALLPDRESALLALAV